MSNKYRSSKLIHKKRVKRFWLTVFFLFLMGLFLWGLIFILNNEKLNVSDFELNKIQYVDENILKEEIQNILNGKKYWLIPKTNLIFLPYQEIRNSILNNHISVANVEFELTDWDILKIEVKEHEPKAIFCKNEENDTCYLLNASGLIYAEKPSLLFEDYILLEGLINQEGNLIGQNYSEGETFKKLIIFSENLQKINIKVQRIFSEDNETFNFYTQNGPYLIFDKYDDSEEVANNLNILIEQEALHDVQFANIKYIDLRFGKKVYYKLN